MSEKMDDRLQQRYDNLSRRLRIDMADVDNELVDMPMLVQEAAELATDANDVENLAHLDYDVARAEYGQRLRLENDRISEARIESSMPLDPIVVQARVGYERAKIDSALCAALVSALRTKSSLLQKAADMMLAGWITPNAAYERRRAEINQARPQYRRRSSEG